MARSIVAVVDDDPSMQGSLECLLDALGFGVEVFVSAEAFVRREPFEHISCVILDIHLSGMSGFDLRRLLSERGYHIPIVFITAVAHEMVVKEAHDGGCVGLLQKPFGSANLIAAIRRAIRDGEHSNKPA